jgi:hypothetical protein
MAAALPDRRDYATDAAYVAAMTAYWAARRARLAESRALEQAGQGPPIRYGGDQVNYVGHNPAAPGLIRRTTK